MVIRPLIERKRDGGALSTDEWRHLIAAYSRDEVPDYQMAALAMAIVFRGLTPDELTALSDAMLDSGDRLRFDGWTVPRVDKHSTGGVGDKTSLILAPLLATCGVAVPMMSGRGLGHTGGTLDKLESIPGFRTRLSLREAEAQVRRIGCAMLGQTEEIAPADRKLYALRDVTATVESIPLIAASIMSKKLAEDLTGLVLDVKTGSGAFLPEVDRALELARTMIGLGERRGCRTVALLTAMDRPLGVACGNALEVAECIGALRGDGPPDLMEVTYTLGAEMLMLAGKAPDRLEARRALERNIASGQAAERFRAMVEAQGGDPRVVDDVTLLPVAAKMVAFAADRAGTVRHVEPRRIGQAIVELGGGRQRVEDAVRPAVGFMIPVKPGQRVEQGQPMAIVHADDDAGLELGIRALREAITIGEPVGMLAGVSSPLILQRVSAAGVEVLS